MSKNKVKKNERVLNGRAATKPAQIEGLKGGKNHLEVIDLKRVTIFAFLTLMFAGQFTYLSNDFPFLGLNKQIYEMPFDIIYQEDDQEVFGTDIPIPNIAKILEEEFSKMETKDLNIFGLPLDWIKHRTCFSSKTTDSEGNSLKRSIIGPAIKIDEERYKILDTYCSIEVEDAVFGYAPEEVEKFKIENLDIIKKNCKANDDNPNNCIFKAKIIVEATSTITSFSALIVIIVLSSSISALFIGQILPVIVKFIRNE